MCPFCLATAAMIASGAAGSGGLGALVAGVVLKKKKESLTQIGKEEVRHDDSNDARETA
jgi:hypothetical protein